MFNIVFKKVMEKAKRFFEVTIFKQYALADGLGRMLFDTGWEDMHPESKKTKPSDDPKIRALNAVLENP